MGMVIGQLCVFSWNILGALDQKKLCVEVTLGALGQLPRGEQRRLASKTSKGKPTLLAQQSPTGTDASVNFEQTYSVNFQPSTFKRQTCQLSNTNSGTGIYKGADMGVKVFMSSSTGDMKARPDWDFTWCDQKYLTLDHCRPSRINSGSWQF